MIFCRDCNKPWIFDEKNRIVPDCKCGEPCTSCYKSSGNARAYEGRDGKKWSDGWEDCRDCNGQGFVAPEPAGLK